MPLRRRHRHLSQRRKRHSSSSSSTSSSSKNKNNYILFFSDVTKNDAHKVGGKGANLGECLRAGLNVPPGFCITANAFKKQMEYSNIKSTNCCQNNNNNNNNIVANNILTLQFLPSLLKEIKLAYKKLGSQMVAVRSSATAEDSATASFAGQLETYLGINGEESLLLAVKECWASLFSERVASYSHSTTNITNLLDKISCCVVVQVMIDADAAGVAFTANPMTRNRNEIVITSNFGLGESVVSDIVTPDTFILDHDGNLITKTISEKNKMVVLINNNKNGGDDDINNNDNKKKKKQQQKPSNSYSIIKNVPKSKQKKSSINNNNLQSILTLCKTVEAHYNSPQDIEWACINNEIYLLQSRPITTLGVEKDHPHQQISKNATRPPPTVNEFDFKIRSTDWITTCNAQEMFPGPGTPLTISTFGNGIEIAMQRLHVEFGVLDKVSKHKDPRAPWFYGHFFINMTNILEVTMRLPLGNHAKSNAEMSLLGRKNPKETLEQLESVHGESFLIKKLINGLFYAKAIAFAPWRIPTMEKRKIQVKDLLRELPNETPISLYNRIDHLLPEYNNQWSDGILTSSPSAGWMLLIMKLIAKSSTDMWSTERLSELSTVLSDSAGNNVESADVVKTLNLLKECIANSEYGEVFSSWPVDKAIDFLENVDNDAKEEKLHIVYRNFINRHGHRCVKEAELRNKDWSEDPTTLIKLLQENVNSYNTIGSRTIETSISLDEMLKTKWSHVSCLTRPILRYAVHQTRAGVARREYGKSMQVHVHSSFKHAYRRLGRLCYKLNIIPEIDLIYFFTHTELKDLLNYEDMSQMNNLHMIKRAVQRREILAIQETYSFDDLGCGIPAPSTASDYEQGVTGDEYTGTPVSVGTVIGIARVVRTLNDAGNLKCGEILVCPFTDVGWTPYFSLASGLITEIGGLLSHGAVVAREYGLPCVVNVKGATHMIQTGDRICLNGENGSVRIL